MNELQAAMKIVLANTFTMYFKAHTYHWNVEGINFSEYHEFFGDLYDELFTAVDLIAERIRIIDAYAPISISDLLSSKTVEEDISKPVGINSMLTNLEAANSQVIVSLKAAFNFAEAANDQGLMDFITGRLDTHAKHAWMIKSSNKTGV